MDSKVDSPRVHRPVDTILAPRRADTTLMHRPVDTILAPHRADTTLMHRPVDTPLMHLINRVDKGTTHSPAIPTITHRPVETTLIHRLVDTTRVHLLVLPVKGCPIETTRIFRPKFCFLGMFYLLIIYFLNKILKIMLLEN